MAFGRTLGSGRRMALAAGALVLAWAAALNGPVSADEPRPSVAAPHAVVILPPRLISGDASEDLAAAELACDRLAERMAADPLCRVVNRLELDRVLKEQALAPEVKGRMFAWDAMLRLEVDAARPIPQVRLTLIDLSLGNPIVSAQHPWSRPLPDETLETMVKDSLAALGAAEAPGPKPLSVRLLGVANTGKSLRMEPLGERLLDALENGLARSPALRRVQHLEAMTAKEESLLILMGLARLAGGREFVPQAGATIELRLREFDGLGKTFDETQVEVGWRVRKGAEYTGDWATATATVKEFDRLIASAWSACARDLDGAAPAAVNQFLDEMALRRKQAQAELDAAVTGADSTAAQLRENLARVAAAAKLDPSWEEAAYRLVGATACARPDGVNREAKAWEASVYEALRYLHRFRSPAEHRYNIYFSGLQYGGYVLHLLGDRDSVELSPADRRLLDALKEILDLCLAEPPGAAPADVMEVVPLVYHGMALVGVPPAERHRWLRQTITRVDLHLDTPDSARRLGKATQDAVRILCRSRAAGHLIDEGAAGEARLYIDELLPILAATRADCRRTVSEKLRKDIETMKAPDLLARLDATCGDNKMLYEMSIIWPEFGPFTDGPPGKSPRVNLKVIPQDKRSGGGFLAAVGRRMYLVTSGGVGFVPLDDDQRPVGKVELLSAQPEAAALAHLTAVAVSGGRLYLGTEKAGLLEYDPLADRWRGFTPKEGLPGLKLLTVLPMGDGTLFCAGQESYESWFNCVVDPARAEVTLVRRPAAKEWGWVLGGFRPAWVSGGKVVGFAGGGGFGVEAKLIDDLLAEKISSRPWRGPLSDGRGDVKLGGNSHPSDMAVIGARRFVLSRDALREIDDAGQVLRTWRKEHDDVALRDMPELLRHGLHSGFCQDQGNLYIGDLEIHCYDPAEDVWYGPLETEPWGYSVEQAVAGRHGLWLGGGQGLAYLETADFKAAAKAAGRALSGAEFRRLREAHILASPPLDRLKWAMMQGQSEKARDLGQAVLAGDPANANAEALLLMGLLHERGRLNQPERSLEFYARLAAIKENPSAALTGLVAQQRLRLAAKQYAEARELGRAIVDGYPGYIRHGDMSDRNKWLDKVLQEMTP